MHFIVLSSFGKEMDFKKRRTLKKCTIEHKGLDMYTNFCIISLNDNGMKDITWAIVVLQGLPLAMVTNLDFILKKCGLKT